MRAKIAKKNVTHKIRAIFFKKKELPNRWTCMFLTQEHNLLLLIETVTGMKHHDIPSDKMK